MPSGSSKLSTFDMLRHAKFSSHAHFTTQEGKRQRQRLAAEWKALPVARKRDLNVWAEQANATAVDIRSDLCLARIEGVALPGSAKQRLKRELAARAHQHSATQPA